MRAGLLLLVVGLGGCAAQKATPAAKGTPAAGTPTAAFTGIAGIDVRPNGHEVTIDAVSCLDEGWLEQIACSPGSREHESLVTIATRPSDIHAALLLAGFEPGEPGHWSQAGDDAEAPVELVPPRGDALSVSVRFTRPGGAAVEEPIGAWIADEQGAATFPAGAVWIFGGSAIVPNPPWMEKGEHYVADLTGSVIGLVTFGDEVLGFNEVLPDQEDVEPPHWQVRSDHVPPAGTAVKLVLRPAAAAPRTAPPR